MRTDLTENRVKSTSKVRRKKNNVERVIAKLFKKSELDFLKTHYYLIKE